jgi:hypothetical protein
MFPRSVIFLCLIFLISCLWTRLPSQIDVTDANHLKSMDYFLSDSTANGETVAAIIFKFDKDAGQYTYTINKDTLFIDFHDAFFDQSTIQDKVGAPFQDFKFSILKENMQDIQDIGARATEVFRVTLPLEKGRTPKVTSSNLRQVVKFVFSSSEDEASSTKEESFNPFWKYLIIGASAALLVTGIMYLVKKTSNTPTDEVIIQ